MARFDECLNFVLAREGGWNPTLDGGTNKGITQATYDAFRNAAGQPTQSVEFVTDDEVEHIYRTMYWELGRCGTLPPPLDLCHFDACVNYGPTTAVRMLQTAMNMGIVDGVFGPRTLAVINTITQPYVTFARYCNLRITRYVVITASKPALKDDLRGFLRRVGYLLAAS